MSRTSWTEQKADSQPTGSRHSTSTTTARRGNCSTCRTTRRNFITWLPTPGTRAFWARSKRNWSRGWPRPRTRGAVFRRKSWSARVACPWIMGRKNRGKCCFSKRRIKLSLESYSLKSLAILMITWKLWFSYLKWLALGKETNDIYGWWLPVQDVYINNCGLLFIEAGATGRWTCTAFLLKVDHAVREKFRTYVVVILEEKEKQSQYVERAVRSVFRTHVVAILGKKRNKVGTLNVLCAEYFVPMLLLYWGKGETRTLNANRSWPPTYFRLLPQRFLSTLQFCPSWTSII